MNKMLKEKEAFHSLQIEGIYPKEWDFVDYINNKHKIKKKKNEHKTNIQNR